MKLNIGITDRIIRMLVAIAVIIFYFTNIISGTLAMILLIISGIFALTSFIGFCPIYGLFGISSIKKPTK